MYVFGAFLMVLMVADIIITSALVVEYGGWSGGIGGELNPFVLNSISLFGESITHIIKLLCAGVYLGYAVLLIRYRDNVPQRYFENSVMRGNIAGIIVVGWYLFVNLRNLAIYISWVFV